MKVTLLLMAGSNMWDLKIQSDYFFFIVEEIPLSQKVREAVEIRDEKTPRVHLGP